MNKVVAIVLLILFTGGIRGQISHGGQPLPFVQLRSSSSLFRDMPSFDLKEELRLDSLNASGLRSGYKFAYKFMTNFNRSNSGESFTLADGTRVWRLGIRSEGALSLNILFSEYELPEGAQVFLYNPEQTEVLGSFTSQNNSALNILPVAPIEGDKLIVEYREPANATFPGRLTVGEVNHGYRSLKGREPGGDNANYYCLRAPVCFMDEEYERMARSTVLLIIDGQTACSGFLMNNTSEDGRPYLLTAAHCLNKKIFDNGTDYDVVAGKIVCFFNYESPTCQTIMRGAEEMSVASASLKAVNEKHDMTLLELLDMPPAYYQPYYAGWNINADGGDAPYTGIHHPEGSVKRVNVAGEIRLVSFNTPTFASNAHWYVPAWDAGTTAGGSSGSPLFDAAYRAIGALSGGYSTCASPRDDYYFALNKVWDSYTPDAQLKDWLDPIGTNETAIDGLDPYASAPCYRLSNIYDQSSKTDTVFDKIEITPSGTGNLFGINPNGTTEYMEEYYANKNAKLYGTYIVTPAVAGIVPEVQIRVYSGNGGPQTLLHTETFKPTYTNLTDGQMVETGKGLNRQQETFVPFSKSVSVSGPFYVGYKIVSTTNTTFAAYNIAPGNTTATTAWINNNGNWAKASFPTSLFIDPVLQYGDGGSSTEKTGPQEQPVLVSKGGNMIYIHISRPVQKASCSIYNASGALVKKVNISGADTTIPVWDCNPGAYLINISGEKLFYTQKIIF